MTRKKREMLESFLTKWREEVERLRRELDRTKPEEMQMRSALAIALTIREEAIKELESIFGPKNQSVLPSDRSEG